MTKTPEPDCSPAIWAIRSRLSGAPRRSNNFVASTAPAMASCNLPGFVRVTVL